MNTPRRLKWCKLTFCDANNHRPREVRTIRSRRLVVYTYFLSHTGQKQTGFQVLLLFFSKPISQLQRQMNLHQDLHNVQMPTKNPQPPTVNSSKRLKTLLVGNMAAFTNKRFIGNTCSYSVNKIVLKNKILCLKTSGKKGFYSLGFFFAKTRLEDGASPF